jgi:hypothetical protein
LKRLAALPARVGAEHKRLLEEVLAGGEGFFERVRFSTLGGGRNLLRWVRGLVADELDAEKTQKLMDAERW